jgi:ABC-type amino acid transport substrate-binding protein
MKRRALLIGALAAQPCLALVREVRAAAPSDRRLSARRWVERQMELSRALRVGTISHGAWRDAVNRLAAEVDVAQLLAESAQGAANTPFMHDPVKRWVHFIGDDGQPMKVGYAAATFTFGPDSVITPHAHEHMVSAHMVVAGKVRIRTFDRIGREDDALIIKPTGDHVGGVGAAQAMTSARDNVHWFTPVTPSAMTFDVIIDGLDPGVDNYLIQPLDPIGGVQRADGSIAAPMISFQTAMEHYTAGM